MNKRPVAVQELKEWQRGHRELGEDLKDKPAGYVGARVAKRLTTDCYAAASAAAGGPTAAEPVQPISLQFGRLSRDSCGQTRGRWLSEAAWSPARSGPSTGRGGEQPKSASSAPSSSRATSSSSWPSAPLRWSS